MNTSNEIYTYGHDTKVLRPYVIKDVIKNCYKKFKFVNILASFVIVGLYPVFLALGINKGIAKLISIMFRYINEPVRY